MKKAVYYLAYLSIGVLVVVWPLAALFSIFLFDSPIRNATDGVTRMVTVLLILIFPFLYWKAHKKGRAALDSAGSVYNILSPLWLPLFVPAWIWLFLSGILQR
jgi:hypothetical protein